MSLEALSLLTTFPFVIHVFTIVQTQRIYRVCTYYSIYTAKEVKQRCTLENSQESKQYKKHGNTGNTADQHKDQHLLIFLSGSFKESGTLREGVQNLNFSQEWLK